MEDVIESQETPPTQNRNVNHAAPQNTKKEHSQMPISAQAMYHYDPNRERERQDPNPNLRREERCQDPNRTKTHSVMDARKIITVESPVLGR